MSAAPQTTTPSLLSAEAYFLINGHTCWEFGCQFDEQSYTGHLNTVGTRVEWGYTMYLIKLIRIPSLKAWVSIQKEIWLCDKVILWIHLAIGQYALTHDGAIWCDWCEMFQQYLCPLCSCALMPACIDTVIPMLVNAHLLTPVNAHSHQCPCSLMPTPHVNLDACMFSVYICLDACHHPPLIGHTLCVFHISFLYCLCTTTSNANIYLFYF